MKDVVIIEPKEVVKRKKNKRLKVAAYCRVSTHTISQDTSMNMQVNMYKEKISNNTEWILAGIYVDYGSGLRIKERKEFARMIQDAHKGKIDLILTKSVSRFSRNTVDFLLTIKKLKMKNIEVIFEVENISSLDSNSEMLMSILAGFAQNEILNMSENVKWGYQRKFERGDAFMKYKNFYGYTFSKGDMKIVPEQAVVVLQMFHWYLEGKTLRGIRQELEHLEITTATGKQNWSEKVILGMLSNEKYMGDSMLQKTYNENYLTGKRKTNRGERIRYYVQNSHEPIISKSLFYEVQAEIKKEQGWNMMLMVKRE